MSLTSVTMSWIHHPTTVNDVLQVIDFVTIARNKLSCIVQEMIRVLQRIFNQQSYSHHPEDEDEVDHFIEKACLLIRCGCKDSSWSEEYGCYQSVFSLLIECYIEYCDEQEFLDDWHFMQHKLNYVFCCIYASPTFCMTIDTDVTPHHILDAFEPHDDEDADFILQTASHFYEQLLVCGYPIELSWLPSRREKELRKMHFQYVCIELQQDYTLHYPNIEHSPYDHLQPMYKLIYGYYNPLLCE